MVQSIDDARRRQQQAPPPGRVPPHNLQAEESLLGAMLLSRDAVNAAAEVRLSTADFYKPAHGHVFDALMSLYNRGEPIDPVTAADELRRDGLLEAVGGTAALVSLQTLTPATSNAIRYAHIVEEHALLRRLIGAAGEIADLGYSLPDDVIGALDRAESIVYEVAQHRVADTLSPLSELLRESFDRLERLCERGDEITGTPTGYADLDRQMSGLQPSSLVVVGARPGAGKTSFALGIAAHAAIEHQLPVLFFSLEMSHMELTSRLLSAEARVESTKLRTGRLDENDWGRINRTLGRLAEAPIFFDDNPNTTVMEIRAKARRLKSKLGGLGVVIVDYLQLMSGRVSAESRQVEVAEMSRGLKILARELEVPVVALSQLSRNLETRADKRPVLADLRESGCVTADSRVLRADTGAEVTIGELASSGARDIPVWSLDENLQMVGATMTHAFCTGVKEVFALRLASGRQVKASANHPFLTIDGWTRLDELTVGSRIAIPRVVPQPKDTQQWPDPEVVMLAHMLGDGCFASRQPVHYTSEDPANLAAVEDAARHFGITPRRVPRGKWTHVYLPSPYRLTHGRHNPIAAWLAQWDLYGLRSHEKFVPADVFSLTDEQLGLFLRHLWATDGCVWTDGRVTRIYYATSSRRLADDVALLLTRFGIVARVRPSYTAGRGGFAVDISGVVDQRRFIEAIGGHGAREEACVRVAAALAEREANTNVDTVPSEIWSRVRARMREKGVTTRAFAAQLGMRYCGSTLYRCSPSRERLGRVADILGDDNLHRLATSDVFWDRVVAIEPLGEQPVFDATVEGTHNFVADGIVVENSIEQDSDVVMFLYRDELYNTDSQDRGTAEVIVSKHRSGPTGVTRLAFLEQFTKFANMAKGV